MKMKTIRIFTIIALTVLYSSCDSDKYLDLYPKTTITEGNFYKTLEQLKQAHDNIYFQLGRMYEAGSVPCVYGELLSDNTHIPYQLGGTPVDEWISNFLLQPENPRFQEMWDNSYNSLYIINTVIHHLEITQVEMAESLKTQMIAEAKLIRSLVYFNMVRAWGSIPYITKKISPTESYSYLRESPDVIYPQLIADLTFAKNNLPASYTGNNVGRVTRFAAAAILAKIHLTRNDKNAAKTELEFIVNSGQFSLDANNNGVVDVNDYYHIFAPATKNSKSSILEAQYLAGANARNSNHQAQYSPYHIAFNLPGATGAFRGGGLNTPTPDLASEFEQGDPRLEISRIPGFLNQTTGLFIDYAWNKKFYDPQWQYPGQNVEIIRYADILLMYAEVTGSAQYLNMVRARVGLPAYGSAGYPSALYPTLELAIEHERRMELCLEFHRFFDLVRTGRAVAVLKAKGLDITENKLLLPIPQYAIDVNTGLTQNPGYN